MISREGERMLRGFLRDAAPVAPADLAADVRATVGATAQRPRWSARLHADGLVVAPRHAFPSAVPLMAVVATLLAALLAVALVGALLRPSQVHNGLLVHTLQDPNRGSFTIYVRDPDGSNPRVIGRGDCPTFVAGGGLLWTGVEERSAKKVFVGAVDGTDVRELHHLAGAVALSVSPDGQRVAWLRQIGTYVEEPEGFFSVPIVELWVSNLEGGPGGRVSTGAPSTVSPYIAPVWSPDGRSIAFAIADDPRLVDSRSASRTEVRLIQADGTNERTISERRGHPFGRMAWSPDGRYLAYGGDFESLGPNLTAGAGELFVADLTAGTETDVTPRGEPAERPVWSPDGRFLAYVGAESRLHLLDMDGGRPAGAPRVRDGIEPVHDIGWAPDGEWIVALLGGPPWERGGLALVDPGLEGPDRTVTKGVVTCLPSWERRTP